MICKHMLLSHKQCVLWRDITEVEEMHTGAKGTTQAPDLFVFFVGGYVRLGGVFFQCAAILGRRPPLGLNTADFESPYGFMRHTRD